MRRKPKKRTLCWDYLSVNYIPLNKNALKPKKVLGYFYIFLAITIHLFALVITTKQSWFRRTLRWRGVTSDIKVLGKCPVSNLWRLPSGDFWKLLVLSRKGGDRPSRSNCCGILIRAIGMSNQKKNDETWLHKSFVKCSEGHLSKSAGV